SDGTHYEPIGALSPNRQILPAPAGPTDGRFTIYDEDGSTVLVDGLPAKLVSGAVYVIGSAE
ncbi:MAG: hypothetical protein ACPL7K_09875, partial [Armatimonadota bacterium]